MGIRSNAKPRNNNKLEIYMYHSNVYMLCQFHQDVCCWAPAGSHFLRRPPPPSVAAFSQFTKLSNEYVLTLQFELIYCLCVIDKTLGTRHSDFGPKLGGTTMTTTCTDSLGWTGISLPKMGIKENQMR